MSLTVVSHLSLPLFLDRWILKKPRKWSSSSARSFAGKNLPSLKPSFFCPAGHLTASSFTYSDMVLICSALKFFGGRSHYIPGMRGICPGRRACV